MPFVPVPNTLMVEVVFEYDSQVVENTLYFERPEGAIDGAEILALLNAIRTTIQTELLPLLTSTIQLVRLVGTLLDAVDAISVTLNVSPPVAGGVAGEALPNNVTYAIQFKTNSRGRSFRGRNFIAGIPADGVDGNQIDPTMRTGLLAYYSELSSVAASEGWQHVVVSRISNGNPRVTGVTTVVSAYATADAYIDSQRRRLPGRGR